MVTETLDSIETTRLCQTLWSVLLLLQVIQQYHWLERELAGVDREATPWLVLFGHRYRVVP